ncbi:MAG TPA: hypothetical protein VMF57_11605 [Solirubrobacteraceae bacterium]|nr:hypothetical protein [Solirubrobacteraceae bacterium]
MAKRAGDRQQSYRDQRDRTRREEHRRDEQLERLVGLQRERHLHSFPKPSVTVGSAAAG